MGIKLEGIEKLTVELHAKCDLRAVRTVVRHNGAQLTSKMKKEADVAFVKINPKTGKRYATGTTERSIQLDLKDDGLTAEVGPTTEYAGFVEYGTRFMDAEPFVRPALEKQAEKFKSDLKKLVR